MRGFRKQKTAWLTILVLVLGIPGHFRYLLSQPWHRTAAVQDEDVTALARATLDEATAAMKI